MWFLTVISYVAILVQIVFITIAIAAGLYYLAELVEEYTTVAKKLIWWMNIVTITLYILLWIFENFPVSMIICGVLAQLAHFAILTNFPYVSFLSPGFLAAVVFIVVNHYLAFSYFASVYYPFFEMDVFVDVRNISVNEGEERFFEKEMHPVIAYFTLYLWLVPFALFVSLSANDNVLPTTTERLDGDVVSNYFSKRNKKYGLLTFFNYAKDSLLPVRTKKGF